MKRDRALAYLAFAIVCIVWGTTYLAIRVAIVTVPPLLMAGIRFTIAGIVMLTIAFFRGERIPRDGRTLGELALIGFLMLAVGNESVIWAEQWVPSGIAALLVATQPLWMSLIESIRRNGERVDLRRGVGMLIGFVGVALLVSPRGAIDMHVVIGALAIQVGGLAWSLGSIRGKYKLPRLPLFTSSALQMLFGGIVCSIAGAAAGEASRISFTPKTFAAVAYLTVFGSVIAYSAYVYALSKLRPTNISLYAYVNPVVAVILGWLILGERLTWVSIVAMCIILGGVALVQTAGYGKKSVSAEPRNVERDAA